MWLPATIIGALVLTFYFYIERILPFSFGNYVKIVGIVVASNWLLYYAFNTAPSFLTVRYIMSGVTHLGTVFIAIVLLKEVLTFKAVCGIVLIVTGAVLLK